MIRNDEIDIIETFIKEVVKDANAKGVVLGVSGGVDSAVVLTLLVGALGKDKVIGLMLPTKYTPQDELKDAIDLCVSLDIEFKSIPMDLMVEFFEKRCGFEPSDLTAGNLTARLRMVVQYYYANQRNFLVAGTTDKSEYFLGFFTKYGDGANDLEPIMHLLKTEVRELAKWLNVPKSILKRKSSPRLWAGHEAEKELGVSYETLDGLLKRNESTEHKRRNIPSLL